MIIRLSRNVYLFISQSSLYCIALYVLKLQSFDHKTKHLNNILLIYIIIRYSDNWFLYAFLAI